MENPPFVDHFSRESVGFPHLCVYMLVYPGVSINMMLGVRVWFQIEDASQETFEKRIWRWFSALINWGSPWVYHMGIPYRYPYIILQSAVGWTTIFSTTSHSAHPSTWSLQETWKGASYPLVIKHGDNSHQVPVNGAAIAGMFIFPWLLEAKLQKICRYL